MKTIKNVWFEKERFYILADDDKVYSRPLEAFPILKETNDFDRNNFKIFLRGKAIRWEKIDEDIHINSFFVTKEPQLDNEIAKLFHQLPYLYKCAVAEQIGIDVSLLKKFIYGIETPAPNMVKKIKNTLRALGEELLEIV